MDIDEPASSSSSTSSNRMAISTIAPSGCDTIQPPTRIYNFGRRSTSPRTTTINSHNDPTLSSDVNGLHEAGHGASSMGDKDVVMTDKGKGRAVAASKEDWLQPPGRMLCSRHQRMADEGTNLLLQQKVDALPVAERETVSNIWSSFSSSSHARRALILQGILTMCCQSELSLLSTQLAQINRVDPFSLFPRELALKILGFVDAKSLTRAAQVSRHWRGLADDDILWKNMCEQHIEKKCLKCGWGLPLLERRPESGPNSPVGAGESAASGLGFKRPAMGPPEERPAKRARSNPPPSQESQYTPPPPPPPRPTKAMARIPSSSPLLRLQLPAAPGPSSNGTPLTNNTPAAALLDSHVTRPWKDVYSERLTVARNWRLGRSTVSVLKGHTDGVMCLQYNDKLQHPSFPILISGSYDRTVRVWNMQTGQEILRLLGHTRAVRALQFDEGKLVTGSMDRTLRLWNWRTGQCIRTLEGHTAGVVCLAFDSNVLVSGSVDKTVKVWNFRTGDCFTLRGHMDWVNSVKIWDRAGTGLEAATPAEGSLDPGKMLFSASDDGTIRLWDLAQRSCVRTFEGHVGQVQSIQVVMAEENLDDEADGDEATGTIAEDAADAKVARLSSPSSPPASNVTPILISGSLDNTIRIWEVESGKKVKTLFGHIEGVWAVASDKLRLASASHDKTIKIWNRTEGKCTATLVGHRGAVTSLALGDDKIVSGSDDGDVRIWSFGGGGGPPTPIPSSSTLSSTS